MLKKDPTQRPTVEEILNSDWLKGDTLSHEKAIIRL